MMNSPLGTIVTFYSWKGGVGRTMALANVAIQLARKGHSVLTIDWDLEAPGLDRYFLGREAQETAHVSSNPAADRSGLIGLLNEAFHQKSPMLDQSAWRSRLINLNVPKSESSPSEPNPPVPNRLDFLPSGYGFDGYASKLAGFSWSEFFANTHGGEWLEALRDQWASAYEFVLIDSRTGLTDSGGVCTIQMPHILVLVFSANEQSVEGGLEIVAAAQRGRAEFTHDRPPLSVIPLLSRWEGENEVDIAQKWMRRLDEDLRPITAPWLPKDFSPTQFLEKTRVPHVPRFSFGEPLPVLTHSLTDPGLPGTYFDILAEIIRSKISNAGLFIDPSYSPSVNVNDRTAIFSLVLDQTRLHQEIARLTKIHGADSLEVNSFLFSAASALEELARYAEAEPLMRRALSNVEKRLGPDGPGIAMYLNGLASLLQETNRYSEAEPLIRRALKVDEATFGVDDPQVAVSLSNLASLLQDTNRLMEAESLLRRAIAINEKAFGLDDPLVAINLNNLARVLKETNRLAEAEPLMRRALAINEQGLGLDHPSIATNLNNLAMLLQATNRLVEAEPLLRRALAIDEKSFGSDHPKVATNIGNLALLLRETNRFDEAEQLLDRALAIDEKSFGPDHPKVAIDLSNLGLLLQERGRLSEAEALMRRALAIDEKSFGLDHPSFATDLNNLAQLLRQTGRLSEAESLMLRSLAISEKNLGPDHPKVATALINLAGLYHQTGRLKEAEPLIRRALAIDENSLGPDHPEVATDLNNLGMLLQESGQLVEAEVLMQRGLSIIISFEKATGHRHINLERGLANYAALLTMMGKTQDEIERATNSLQS